MRETRVPCLQRDEQGKVRFLLVLGVLAVLVILLMSLIPIIGGDDYDTALGSMGVKVWGVDAEGNTFPLDVRSIDPAAKVVVGGKIITKILFQVTFQGMTDDPNIDQYKTYLATSGESTGLFIAAHRLDDDVKVFTFKHYAGNLWQDKSNPQLKNIGTTYNLRSGAANDFDSLFELTSQDIEGNISPDAYVFKVKAVVSWSKTDSTVPIISFVEFTFGVSVEAGTVSMNISAISCSTDVGGC
jgi:hypothetical protein